MKDDYTKESDAHCVLEGAWTGTTEFKAVVKDVEVEDNRKSEA